MISSITRSRYRYIGGDSEVVFPGVPFGNQFSVLFWCRQWLIPASKSFFPLLLTAWLFGLNQGSRTTLEKLAGPPAGCLSRRPPLVFSQWIIERDAMLFPGPPADFLLQWQLPEFCSIVQRPWRPEGFVKSVRCDRLLLIKSQGKALDSVVKASSSFALLYWSEPM